MTQAAASNAIDPLRNAYDLLGLFDAAIERLRLLGRTKEADALFRFGNSLLNYHNAAQYAQTRLEMLE